MKREDTHRQTVSNIEPVLCLVVEALEPMAVHAESTRRSFDFGVSLEFGFGVRSAECGDWGMEFGVWRLGYGV